MHPCPPQSCGLLPVAPRSAGRDSGGTSAAPRPAGEPWHQHPQGSSRDHVVTLASVPVVRASLFVMGWLAVCVRAGVLVKKITAWGGKKTKIDPSFSCDFYIHLFFKIISSWRP